MNMEERRFFPDIAGNLDAETVRQTAFARAWPPLPLEAGFKQRAEDFRVDERLDIDFTGEGEHCWLQIEKRQCNTQEVAQWLARFAGVKRSAVGYAGLKDRQSVSRQWFSVHLPGQADPDWRALESERVRVLQSLRHARKLQRGALSGNHFRILLRQADARARDRWQAALEQRLALLAGEGAPNYFGEQRFGRQRGNLLALPDFFSGPVASKRRRLSHHQRGLLLSAARAWLFNQLLHQRVRAGNWNRRLPGDAFMLDGRSACFADDGSDDIDTRLAAGAIHPSGCLWGQGEPLARGEARALQQQVIDAFPLLRDGLLAARVTMMQRPLRLIPRDIGIETGEQGWWLRFRLPPGAYATSIVRELLNPNGAHPSGSFMQRSG